MSIIYNSIAWSIVVLSLNIYKVCGSPTRHTNPAICRLVQLDIPPLVATTLTNISLPNNSTWLFYNTENICNRKPVYRSVWNKDWYQLMSPTNQWTFYDMKNMVYEESPLVWCSAWDAVPLFSMPLSYFQHPVRVPKQRWQRIIVYEEKTYDKHNITYKNMHVPSMNLKCFQPQKVDCDTKLLTILFDLTKRTKKNDLKQMKLFAKTMTWLLSEMCEIKISVTTIRHSLETIKPFDDFSVDNENLFDVIDTLKLEDEKSVKSPWSIQWPDAIRFIVTKVFKNTFQLPLKLNNRTKAKLRSKIKELVLTPKKRNASQHSQFWNDWNITAADKLLTMRIVTETENLSRNRRDVVSTNSEEQVLLILSARSNSIFEFNDKYERLEQFVSNINKNINKTTNFTHSKSVRLVFVDFGSISNQKIHEMYHSSFLVRAKHSLSSTPRRYNYIETYQDLFDSVHTYLFDNVQRLYRSPFSHLNPSLLETTRLKQKNVTNSNVCQILVLENETGESNSTNNNHRSRKILNTFEYTFYKTHYNCYTSSVYRSIANRNMYLQKDAANRWIIVLVDPVSTMPSSFEFKKENLVNAMSTIYSDLEYSTQSSFGNWTIINDDLAEIFNVTIQDLPSIAPSCSKPGVEILFQSINIYLQNDLEPNGIINWSFKNYSFNTSYDNMTSHFSCNTFEISCTGLDLLVLIDLSRSAESWKYLTGDYPELLYHLRTFLYVLLSYLDSETLRFGMIIILSNEDRLIMPIETVKDKGSVIRNVNMTLQTLLYKVGQSTISQSRMSETISFASDLLLNNSLSNNRHVLLTIPTNISLSYSIDEISLIRDVIDKYSMEQIRYIVLDPMLRTNNYMRNKQFYLRELILRSMASKPYILNYFSSYGAHRDLTFGLVFEILDTLCGTLSFR